MIVLTKVKRHVYNVLPGDEFHLRVHDDTGCEVVLRETITVAKTIDYIATFRFALEDGSCAGFHLTGIFGQSHALPKEIANAVRLEDLSPEQLHNFVHSIGVEVGMRGASE